MTTIYSVVNQPNDRFGYSCYALVIPASDAITAKVEELRNTMGVTVASIPAHITVKGTFFNIESLDQVKQSIASITHAHTPFYISFQNAHTHWWQDVCALTIPVTPPLQALHDALVATIAPLGLPAYQDDPYVVHMTLLYGQGPERQAGADALISQLALGPGFQAEVVHLMGRVGPRVGGQWQLIERFGLGGA